MWENLSRLGWRAAAGENGGVIWMFIAGSFGFGLFAGLGYRFALAIQNRYDAYCRSRGIRVL